MRMGQVISFMLLSFLLNSLDTSVQVLVVSTQLIISQLIILDKVGRSHQIS